MHSANSKDNNLVLTTISYFGVIAEIWEVDYVKFRVLVFKCKWFDSNRSACGFSLVNLAKRGSKEGPLIMAYQAKQVFYVEDASNERWSLVIKGRNEYDGNNHDDSRVRYSDNPSFSRHLPLMNEENDVDEVLATRNDHNEEI